MSPSNPPLDDLVARVQHAANLADPDAALKWLRSVASILADWGGRSAARALHESLPRDLFTGRGASGRSHAAALRHAGPGALPIVLHVEAGHRAGETDPAKFAHGLRAVLGVLKQQLGPARSEAVASALPAAAAAEMRSAGAAPSYAFRLIPQSYARPSRTGPHH